MWKVVILPGVHSSGVFYLFTLCSKIARKRCMCMTFLEPLTFSLAVKERGEYKLWSDWRKKVLRYEDV